MTNMMTDYLEATLRGVSQAQFMALGRKHGLQDFGKAVKRAAEVLGDYSEVITGDLGIDPEAWDEQVLAENLALDLEISEDLALRLATRVLDTARSRLAALNGALGQV